MAFNFNWSPLIADTSRARDMLTAALNKSPKPPIIVDDIIVNELNLGSTPPELEILEIGDLAEDRFRGIFKMSYTGDAYLTLKTRVQANPLNTYLSTKPNFASPAPLAASSGLTIPLQITLSDIRLSGFVILVFSRQKGITLVFRNDPLESLKVSSTFDSIPFVRNFLQKEIEAQLRVLFMEDLPAIIHRLSLQLFSPEYQAVELQTNQESDADGQQPIDPLASPPQNAVDTFGNPLDDQGFSLESQSNAYPTFSQKNLIRLAALNESQRTLSLFTPAIRDTVFRAWAGTAENLLTGWSGSPGSSTPMQRPQTLSRIQSSLGTEKAGSSWSSAASQVADTGSHAIRPSLVSYASAPTVYSLGSGRPRAHHGRKRKNRIVDLRTKAAQPNAEVNETASVSSGYDESRSSTGTDPSALSTDPTSSASRVDERQPEREGELNTPPRTPRKKVGFERPSSKEQILPSSHPTSRTRPTTPRASAPPPSDTSDDLTPRATQRTPTLRPQRPSHQHPYRQPLSRAQTLPPENPAQTVARSLSEMSLAGLGASPFGGAQGSSGGILENAWMMKMAGEIARKVAEEKGRGDYVSYRPRHSAGERSVSDGVGEAPPAYVS